MKKRTLGKAIPMMIFVIALVFITVGLMREEQRIVLNEAVNICLECIGIG